MIGKDVGTDRSIPVGQCSDSGVDTMNNFFKLFIVKVRGLIYQFVNKCATRSVHGSRVQPRLFCHTMPQLERIV